MIPNKLTDYDLERALQNVYQECLPLAGQGTPAGYIPELAQIDPKRFGLCLHTIDGNTYCAGDTDIPFSIQSISKVFILAMILPHLREQFFRIHVEPSGDPFNSLVQLEYENGIPRNPFINAGALVATDILIGLEINPKQAILDFLSQIYEGSRARFNLDVARSEIETAHRNRSLAYLIKSFGNLHSDIETLLDVYCHHCSIEMSLKELASTFAAFANGGISPSTNARVLSGAETKRINALMLSCGFYDESGEFAYRVGLPGKSGVGGGIITVLPGQFTLATWSPGLNDKGNSLVGMRALEMFTSQTGLSLF
jgi:glutaminase